MMPSNYDPEQRELLHLHKGVTTAVVPEATPEAAAGSLKRPFPGAEDENGKQQVFTEQRCEERMSEAIRGGEKTTGLMSESRDLTDDQSADTNTHLKTRSSPVPLSLARCAACYNHKSSTVSWRGDAGESSSSAEDSGPEVEDEESEAESSSSSSSSCRSSVTEEPEPERSGDAAEEESRGDGGEGGGGGGGGGGEGGDETVETSNRQEDKNEPPSLTPHLLPRSFLPRPPQVVSTLHLQVLPQNCGDDETLFNIRELRPEREEEQTQGGYGGGRGGGGGGGGGGSIYKLLPPQPHQPPHTVHAPVGTEPTTDTHTHTHSAAMLALSLRAPPKHTLQLLTSLSISDNGPQQPR
ncbi:unnamed protein product [Pleuronectes platessa]|uniref:Uncharacterized protein n=1 Tax=Pleuronectes platessa TaxID=8262 RepID=A0A9N7W0K7_PLEPL|nr:unnamed protein product [Pleuronectes platessa]